MLNLKTIKTMTKTVIGIFDNFKNAQQAAQQLMTKGFIKETIDISNKNNQNTYEQTAHKEDDDSISNFFNYLFGNTDESRKYTEAAQGKSVITVHTSTNDEAERAADILDDCGAVDVDQQEAKNKDMATGKENTTIPVMEEQVAIGKRVVETGGVRIRSRIVEKPVEERLRLREEHIHVEHNKVNRVATEADLAQFKQSDVKITERAQVPVVAKEARVVEEIKISKEVDEHQETVHETARATEVEVEELENNQYRR
jgi:stress response protein YsnF